jgi:hypothetical protein
MKSFDTDLKKYSEKINLKASERRELRERVLSYMEYHPLPKQGMALASLEVVPSESFVTLHINALYARIAGGVFVALLVATPFVAERSAPGDVLYFVKTGLNESIQSQLANSPYEKIEFETMLMERRISEARALASEGKLTPEVQTQLAETVKEHADAVQSGLAELRTQDADSAALAQIAFNSSLEVQSAMLGVEEGEETENTALIGNILDVVNEAREGAALSQGSTTPSFDGLTAKMEQETTRAYELFAAIQQSATEEEVRDIERRLHDIDRLTLEAEETHTTDTGKGVNDLATALGLVKKLVVFMTNIDVRETVSLESIVPVVLSDAERVDLVKEEMRVLGGMKMDVLGRLESLKGKGVVDKVTEGLATVDELLLKATIALEANDVGGAETVTKEARALITDLDALVPHQEVLPTTDVEPEAEVSAGEVEGAATTTEAVVEEVGGE